MKFLIKSLFFTTQEDIEFTNENPPGWLIHKEYRWFFEKNVLTLEVGQSVDTDFNTITRIS